MKPLSKPRGPPSMAIPLESYHHERTAGTVTDPCVIGPLARLALHGYSEQFALVGIGGGVVLRSQIPTRGVCPLARVRVPPCAGAGRVTFLEGMHA